jgi:malonyl-CoA O-methyltransferase
VIRGFLAVLDEMPQLEGNLRRACEFVVRQIGPDGEVRTPVDTAWRTRGGEVFSAYTNLYVLPPLVDAGSRLGEPRYTEAALKSLEFYKRRSDLVEFKASFETISHIFGYMLEALADLGEVELARQGLRQAAAIQGADGAVPAYPGAAWICTPGIAQLGLAWLKIGEYERAHRALVYVESRQHPTGGWFGSYGPGSRYFPDAEISWVPKFFLDGWALRGAVT